MQEEARRKTSQAQVEQQARLRAEKELEVVKLAQVKAEETAWQKAQEAEAERQAKLKAEEGLRRAEEARVQAEQAVERKSRNGAAEQQAKHSAEQQPQYAEYTTLKSAGTSIQSLVKHCPRCSRAFSAFHRYCLYDSTLLVDDARPESIAPSKPSRVTKLVVLVLVILALLGTGAAGIGITYFPQWWHGPELTQESKEQISTANRDEAVIVGGELNGKETVLPTPEYPARAKRIGASGKVTVAVDVDKNGTVVRAYALDGHPFLQGVARIAAKKAKFSADKLNQPLTSGTITYTFK